MDDIHSLSEEDIPNESCQKERFPAKTSINSVKIWKFHFFIVSLQRERKHIPPAEMKE